MTVLLRAKRIATDREADAVLIDGEFIAAVGAFEDLQGAEVDLTVDLGELTLSPGLVDTHVHMTGNGQSSASTVIQQEPASALLLRAAENARRALAEGVTTLRDCELATR